MTRLLKGLLVAALMTALVVPLGCSGPAPVSDTIVFTYLEGQVIGTIDPAKHVDESSLHAVLNLYDPLLFPKISEGSMEPGPHVAESWDISSDGKTYTFYLRDDIQFHNGDFLTAEDVAFTMERNLALKKGFSWLWQGVVEKTEVINEHTVAFHLARPYAPFISTMLQLFIVNKDQVMANVAEGDFGEFGDYGQAYLETEEVGSGPYMKQEWNRGTEFVFTRFDDYWKGWRPGQIHEVHYKIVLEEATKKTMIKSGEADMVDQWMAVESFNELENTAGIIVDKAPSVQLLHFPIHTRKAPTDNIHVRRAICWAFDYETANEMAGGIQAQGPVPIQAWGHNGDVFVFHQDLDKAREELDLSGYEPGEVKLTYVYANSVPVERTIGLLLKSNLEEIGIELEIIGEPWARMTEMAASMEATPHLMGIFDTLKYPHPDSHTYGLYHPSSHGSYRSTAWLNVPEITQKLEAARRAVNLDEQIALYQEVQELIVDEAPSLYISNPFHRIAYRDHVKGYTFVGLLGYDLWFPSLIIEQGN